MLLNQAQMRLTILPISLNIKKLFKKLFCHVLEVFVSILLIFIQSLWDPITPS